MPRIDLIELHISTGDRSGAGTDGDVYLGLCGREFFIDTTTDDFERGAGRNYSLGDGADINHAAVNDPRRLMLFTEKVTNFPVYIRFQPRSRSDNWHLQRADVRFNGSVHIDWDTANLLDDSEGIWLGVRSGLLVHLEKLGHE